MNKETFLQELEENLKSLSAKEKNKVLDYYREMIYDEMENGKSEDTVLQDFGSPADIADQICSDYTRTDPKPAVPSGKIYSPDGAVNEIQLSAQNIRVAVHPIPEGNLRILFTPLSFDTVTVTEEAGVFTFTQTAPMHLFHIFELFHQPRIITLEVPDAFSGNVRIKTSNARLTVENLKHLKTGSFTTSNARTVISDTFCESLQIHTSNAKIELSDCSGTGCTAKTSNGRITVSNCSYPGELTLHTNNGSINADRIVSSRIQFKTANAPINALIPGDARDYAIHSHTSNGRNSLPTDWSFPGQNRSLSAETSNAHIDIKFSASAD